MTVGERIKQARKAAGLSRKQLSELSRVKYPTLAGLENGDQKGSTAIPALAEALGVSAVWLGEGRGQMGRSSVQEKALDYVVSKSRLARLDRDTFTQAKQFVLAEETLYGKYPRGELVDQVFTVYDLMAENGGFLTDQQREERFAAARLRPSEGDTDGNELQRGKTT